jgi:hypothetical protein
MGQVEGGTRQPGRAGVLLASLHADQPVRGHKGSGEFDRPRVLLQPHYPAASP